MAVPANMMLDSCFGIPKDFFPAKDPLKLELDHEVESLISCHNDATGCYTMYINYATLSSQSKKLGEQAGNL